jgi:hypothetical protein
VETQIPPHLLLHTLQAPSWNSERVSIKISFNFISLVCLSIYITVCLSFCLTALFDSVCEMLNLLCYSLKLHQLLNCELLWGFHALIEIAFTGSLCIAILSYIQNPIFISVSSVFWILVSFVFVSSK